MRNLVLMVCLLFVLLSSCKTKEEEDALCLFDTEFFESYAKVVYSTNNPNFNMHSNLIASRKWISNPQYYIGGSPSESSVRRVHQAFDEINALQKEQVFYHTLDSLNANIYVFIAFKSEMKSYLEAGNLYHDTTLNEFIVYFALARDINAVLQKGYICITQDHYSQRFVNRAITHEIMHILGFRGHFYTPNTLPGYDTNDKEISILTYGGEEFTPYPAHFSELDKKMIAFHYSEYIKPGMLMEEARAVLTCE